MYGFPGSSTQQTPNYPVMVLARPSLLGYWRFNESEGTSFRDELGLHSLISSGGSGGTFGAQKGPVYGGGYWENSGGDTLTGWDAGGYSQRSWEFWISSTHDGMVYNEPGIDNATRAIQIQVGSGETGNVRLNVYSFNYGLARGTTGRSLNDGLWHHVVVTANGAGGVNFAYSHFKIYLDGFEATAYTDSAYNVNAWPTYRTSIWRSTINSKLAEYAIYAEALSAQWIYDHYRTAR